MMEIVNMDRKIILIASALIAVLAVIAAGLGLCYKDLDIPGISGIAV